MDLKTLSTDEVLSINQKLVEDFRKSNTPIFPEGVKSQNLLESAVDRQNAGWGEKLKYPTVAENASTLLYGLCCNHPFHNGNKRTALVCMLAHLDKNGKILRGVNHSELMNLLTDVAGHTILIKHPKIKKEVDKGKFSFDEAEILCVTSWLKDNRMHEIKRGDKPITFRELKRILARFNFQLENPKGNSIDLIKVDSVPKFFGGFKEERKKIYSISYSGETKFVSIHSLKEIRKRCALEDKNGCDSSAFYDWEATVDSFIVEYSGILKKLANK